MPCSIAYGQEKALTKINASRCYNKLFGGKPFSYAAQCFGSKTKVGGYHVLGNTLCNMRVNVHEHFIPVFG